MRFISRIFARVLFGFKIHNADALKATGPVLLVPNHASWFDWWIVGMCLQEDWKFVVSSTRAESHWIFKFVMRNRFTFPIDNASPFAIKEMSNFLKSGGRLVLFAEGRLTETGSLMKLFEGTGFLLEKTNAKIITCYQRNAHRLPYSKHPGWKKIFPRLTIHFGEPQSTPQSLSNRFDAREAYTQWLREQLMELQFRIEMKLGPQDLLTAIASMGRARPKSIVLEDVTGQRLNHRMVMVGSEVLSRKFQNLLSPEIERVGLLLPNVNATPITLLALWRLGKVPAILNYSSGVSIMQTCSDLAGVKQIITSQAFLEKAGIDIQPMKKNGIEFIYLEEVRKKISVSTKLSILMKHKCRLGKSQFHITQDKTAVVLFTSGSEGIPKGVELTHKNILSNLRQLLVMVDILDTDSIFNCLPMFHSFGLVVGTLLPLCRGLRTTIFPSPLQYRVIPTAVYNSNSTIFLSTNTFLNGYAKKAHPYDFRNVRYLLAGAEKIQQATSDTWARKFGIRITEAYGVTECSPGISANTKADNRFGSVGRILPDMKWKLEPVDGVKDAGRLFVKGPNVMKGYLNKEANEAFQSLNGWYDTGDIVKVDEDGYFWIKGRAKRFAKISGEMVSLTAVEDALAGAFPNHGEDCEIAVIAITDEDKGEKLIAVTNEPNLTTSEIRNAVADAGLINLCTPREIHVLKEIPKLGTGKLNHREAQRLVEEK
ncbi:MAG: AMP-dependent synthetase [Opitutia bacterium TMED67]|nr:AMP-dependent synthetase [Verrucomicrobiales bacterium]OUU70965.1 MAG: AMP-dependent synthetase [Opitutae bacterium TMED67]